MADIQVKGLDEFRRKLQMVEKKAPERIEKKLEEMAKEVKSEAKSNTKRITGRLQDGYALEDMKKTRTEYSQSVYNDAPHAHLVEEGHRKVSQSGKLLGWTDGLFILEDAILKKNATLTPELRAWLNTLYEELNK